MSAVVEFTLKVYTGSGRPPSEELTSDSELAIMKEVIEALLDVRTHRIEITRTES